METIWASLIPYQKTADLLHDVLTRLVCDFQTYVKQNSAYTVDYAERHRYGERISTGFAKSAVNQVLTKRLMNRQQMQWTKKGARLVVQTRTKMLNEEWRTVFGSSIPASRGVPTDGCLTRLPHTF